MRKRDIAKRIARQATIPERDAVTLLDWMLWFLKTILQQGGSIDIPNFGKLEVRSKTSRPGRNPRTDEVIMIAARRVVIFRASSHLKTEVNAVTRSNGKMQRASFRS